jgi:hypothetical protein
MPGGVDPPLLGEREWFDREMEKAEPFRGGNKEAS